MNGARWNRSKIRNDKFSGPRGCMATIRGALTVSVAFGIFSASAQFDQSAAPARDVELNPHLKTPITLSAKDASLSEILKVLSDRSEMNFVSGEGINKERITIMLNKTPLHEAISILVRAAGLSYEIIGNSVLIATPDRLKEDVGMQAYVVDLKYAPAPEVARMLSDISARIKVDEGGNRLICFAGLRVIEEIRKIVQAIDHPHILVVLETRLVEARMDNLRKHGIDWSQLSQVAVGVNYPQGWLIDGVRPDDLIRLPVNLRAVLDLMAQKGEAKVLMDSRLTTTNNREARLHIGEVIPYTVQTYNLSSSGGVNLSIQKEEVGVKLRVTPHINENRQVTLTLEPEVSSIVGWKGPGGEIPLVRVRKAQTTVRVEDGQTVLLGGLLQDEKIETINKLPLLGDIPIIGYPFQHRRRSIQRTNLIIQITPRIIYDPKAVLNGSLNRQEMETQYRELYNEVK